MNVQKKKPIRTKIWMIRHVKDVSVDLLSEMCFCMQSRARDLFYGLWVNDLFLQRVEANQEWSLFCPNEAPGLADVWGEEFNSKYIQYEREGRAKKTIRAQQLWFAILEAQVDPLFNHYT